MMLNPVARTGLIACALLATAFAVKAQQTPTAKPDADMQSVLDALASLKPKPIEKLSAAEARKQPSPADAVNVVLKKKGMSTDPTVLVPGVQSADRTIDGAAGQIPATIYTPDGAGPFPVIVYYHGGGWVIANRKIYDGGARGLSKQANAVVVSIDYRQAPENKFPAAWDDALAAYKWTLANATSIKGDPKKLAIAGESAGGGLAVATAIAVRDAGLQPPLHVLSVYPIAQTSLNTPSYKENAKAKPLNRDMMQWFLDKTIASSADLKDPRMSLVDAKLQGLPPVTIVNASIDPLNSDGEMLAAALKKAGVPVERKVYNGATHEFFGMAAVVAKAKDAQAYAGQRLSQAFSANAAATMGNR
ncbi:MAG: alpha/beta hydrolase [Pseudomonadota bacterium]|nr:alpha/beta hydrolase [Pseudomonadota bacterium]